MITSISNYFFLKRSFSTTWGGGFEPGTSWPQVYTNAMALQYQMIKLQGGQVTLNDHYTNLCSSIPRRVFKLHGVWNKSQIKNIWWPFKFHSITCFVKVISCRNRITFHHSIIVPVQMAQIAMIKWKTKRYIQHTFCSTMIRLNLMIKSIKQTDFFKWAINFLILMAKQI